MSDRIAVMHGGRILQCDAPQRIFRRPRTRFVASFFRGCNVLEVDADGGGSGAVVAARLAGVDVPLAVPRDFPRRSGRFPVALRAEDVHVGDAAAAGEVKVPVTVKEVVYRGTNIDYLLSAPDGQELVATSTRREVGLEAGTTATAGFSAGDVVPLLEDAEAEAS